MGIHDIDPDPLYWVSLVSLVSLTPTLLRARGRMARAHGAGAHE